MAERVDLKEIRYTCAHTGKERIIYAERIELCDGESNDAHVGLHEPLLIVENVLIHYPDATKPITIK